MIRRPEDALIWHDRQIGRWTSEHAPAWSPTEEGVIYYLHDLNWDGYPRRLNVDHVGGH